MEKPKYSLDKAFAMFAKRCSVAEKCEKDISTKLREWGFSTAEAQTIIDKLKSNNFISEERFARAYVRDKSRFGGWGELKIRNMLYTKGISKNAIDSAISENLNKDEQQSKCYELLKKKLPTIKYKDRYDLKNKLIRFGMGRGYEFDILDKHISKLINSVQEN